MTFAISRLKPVSFWRLNHFANRRLPFFRPHYPIGKSLDTWHWQIRTIQWKWNDQYSLDVNKIYILKNHVFHYRDAGNRELRSILQFLKGSNFEGIVIERSALMGHQEWAAELLTYLAQLKMNEIRFSAFAEPNYGSNTIIELILPTEIEVENHYCYLFDREKRPEAFEIFLKHLSPKMIENIAHLIARSSHAYSFEISFRKTATDKLGISPCH